MMVTGGGPDVKICTSHADLKRCVRIQETVWGPEWYGLTPLIVFVVAANIGGQILGAFQGRDLVGFTMSLPAVRSGIGYLHSHMLAVLPEYRDQGIGRSLKIAQYQNASQSGIKLIEWTFDPFNFKNAYFNIVRLGAIVRRFVPDFYGRFSNAQGGTVPTDRMIAEWHLPGARVRSSLQGHRYVAKPNAIRVPLPLDIAERSRRDPSATEVFRKQVRRDLMHWLRRGYAVTAFACDKKQATYFLEVQ